MTISNAQPYRHQAIALLKAANLPVTDIPNTLDNFLVALIDDEVIGVAGIEIYGSCGLLRSVAVSANHRGLGIAGNLVERIVLFANAKGLSDLYLLTETASAYFNKKGFIPIERGDVPTEIKVSSEFSHICPVSAIVMKKSI